MRFFILLFIFAFLLSVPVASKRQRRPRVQFTLTQSSRAIPQPANSASPFNHIGSRLARLSPGPKPASAQSPRNRSSIRVTAKTVSI